MWKKYLIVIVALAILLGALYGWHHFVNMKIAEYMSKKPPATVVNVEKAKTVVWHGEVRATGSVLAAEGVDVNSEVAGQVVKIFFKSGDHVKQGEPIIALNSDILKAQLANDKANLALAKVSFERQKALSSQDASSISEYDKAKAQYEEDLANLAQTEAKLKQTLIVAPFSGVLGIRQVDLGQYINPGDKIVNLQSLTPIMVDFTLPESELAHVTKGLNVTIKTLAYPKTSFQGKIIAVDSNLSKSARSLMYRAEINNPEGLLTPGMFANVAVQLKAKSTHLVVPQIAVTYSQIGNYVFVAKDGKAMQKYVTLGQRRGSEVIVTKGLQAGDAVIYAGQSKVRNESPVTVKPAVNNNAE